MNLNISNVQHFSVGDGDGIRTTVFFKGCNLCCPWCHNPENLSFDPVSLCYQSTGKTEVLGRQVTIEELLPELLEDKDFYEVGGGGVTLSGGEVMLQSHGATLLSKRLKEEGVSVLIDTAGCVPYENFERLNPFVHGYLFDFKTADEADYSGIGGDLELVTENLKRLMADGMSVTVRIPLIPDFNADEASVEAICRHLQKISVRAVELLPFHRLGSGKYEAMGLKYAYAEREPFSKAEIARIKAQYENYFEVKIGG